MYKEKIIAAAVTLLLCAGLCGCGNTAGNSQTENSQTENKSAETTQSEAENGESGVSENENTEKSAQPVVKKDELTDEQKTLSEQNGISEERYCTDNEGITKVAEYLLNQYYEGMSEADHDKCFNAFPDFYKKAVEEENKEYGETNDEYMQSIKTSYAETFGDDFYVFASVTSVLQLDDDSLAAIQEAVKQSFDTDCVIDDAYYMYFTENDRGSLDKTSVNLEFSILQIDGTYYLYDDYFEDYSQDVQETAAEESAQSSEVSQSSEDTQNS